MSNFSKDKLLVTISNIFLYISFVLVYFHIFNKVGVDLKIDYIPISAVLLTISLILIVLFIYLRFKHYRHNNINLKNVEKSYGKKIKTFVILQMVSIFICLVSILLSVFLKTNHTTDLIIYNIALILILGLTIFASFLETLLRIKLLYSGPNENNLEVKA